MRLFTRDDETLAREAIRFDGYDPYDTVDDFVHLLSYYTYQRERADLIDCEFGAHQELAK